MSFCLGGAGDCLRRAEMNQTVKQRKRVFLKSELVILVCLLCFLIVMAANDLHSTEPAVLTLVAKISACEAAIRIDPNDPEAYRNLASAYCALHRWDKTIEFATKALDLDPDDADAHYLLGVSCWMLDRDEEVESNLKEAIRLDPKHFDAQSHLASYYRTSGRYEESIEATKHAISIRPDDAVQHFSLGDDYFAFGKYEEAIEAYEQAIKIVETSDRELAEKLRELYNTLGFWDQ